MAFEPLNWVTVYRCMPLYWLWLNGYRVKLLDMIVLIGAETEQARTTGQTSLALNYYCQTSLVFNYISGTIV